jgi:hypothetical protein
LGGHTVWARGGGACSPTHDFKAAAVHAPWVRVGHQVASGQYRCLHKFCRADRYHLGMGRFRWSVVVPLVFCDDCTLTVPEVL